MLHEDDNGTCRLDMQGVIQTNPPQHNLQVQLNKGKGYNPKKSTIATALVSESLQTQGPMNQNVVVNTVRTALGTSLKDGYIYIVEGTVP